MVDDGKIKHSNTQNPFLPDKLVDPDQESIVHYSLEEEYKKTKGNRQGKLYGSVAVFVLLMIIIPLIFYYINNEKINKVAVTIDDFEDIHLQEITQSMSSVESQLKWRKKELEDLKFEQKRKQDVILQEHERLLAEIKTINFPEHIKKEKVTTLQKLKDNQLEELEKTYTPLLAEKNDQVEELQSNIASIGNQLGTKKEKADMLTSGKEKLYEIRLQQLSQKYNEIIDNLRKDHAQEISNLILTYNPVFKQEEILEIIDPPIDIKDQGTILASGVRSILTTENIASTEKLATLDKKLEELDLLTDKIKKIPFRNSMQSSILHVDELQRDNILVFNSLLTDASATIEKKNGLLDSYSFAVNSMFKDRNIMGYVLDQRNQPEVLLYMRSDISITDEDTGYLYGDNYSIDVRFIKHEGKTYAILTNTERGDLIKPFDRVYVNTKDESKE